MYVGGGFCGEAGGTYSMSEDDDIWGTEDDSKSRSDPVSDEFEIVVVAPGSDSWSDPLSDESEIVALADETDFFFFDWFKLILFPKIAIKFERKIKVELFFNLKFNFAVILWL